MDARANPITGRLIVGLAMLSLGVLWTLDNLGYLDASYYLQWWPVIVIGFGLVRLMGFGTQRSVGSGLFLTLVGSLLLLGNLGLLHVHLWPLFLVAAGVAMIVRSFGRGSRAGADTGDWVHSFALMGGVTRRSSSPAFRGGDLFAFMGGVQLDLTDAQLEGGRAVVDVFAMWGGIEIRVPDHWRVELEATPIMGGFEDNSRPSTEGEITGVLVVRGFVMMGGVEIKNGALDPDGRMRIGVHGPRSGDTVVINKVSTNREGWSTSKVVTVSPAGVEIRRSSGPADAPGGPGAPAAEPPPAPTEPK